MTREELERMLTDAGATGSEPRFDGGFADRVMQRLARERADARTSAGVANALARQARRVIPALAAASLVISAWNWWSVRDRADSPLTAALGLERVSLATALSSGAMVGADGLQ